jgi:abequosyltransferase
MSKILAALSNPFKAVSSLKSRIYTLMVKYSFPFASIGKNVWFHHSCDLEKNTAKYISIGNSVSVHRDVWINIQRLSGDEPALILDDGCTLNRRCTISAKNRIHIGRDVIFGPSVLLMDHNHAFEDVNIPIALQGVTQGGVITIEDGCWIGFGVAIVCGENDIVIGRNSVIGANSLVTRSIPPNSVAIGNPARVIRQYDPAQGKWILGSVKAKQSNDSAIA